MAIERELIQTRLDDCQVEANRLKAVIETAQTNLHANQGAIQVLQKLLDACDAVDAVEAVEAAGGMLGANGKDQDTDSPD